MELQDRIGRGVAPPSSRTSKTLTGAAVAAATSLVGAADKGGSWRLDATFAAVAEKPLTTEAAAAYAAVLDDLPPLPPQAPPPGSAADSPPGSNVSLDLDTTSASVNDTSTYDQNDGSVVLFGNASVSSVSASSIGFATTSIDLSIAQYNGTETLALSAIPSGLKASFNAATGLLRIELNSANSPTATLSGTPR